MIRVCLDVSGSDWIESMPERRSDTGTGCLLTLCSVDFFLFHGVLEYFSPDSSSRTGKGHRNTICDTWEALPTYYFCRICEKYVTQFVRITNLYIYCLALQYSHMITTVLLFAACPYSQCRLDKVPLACPY